VIFVIFGVVLASAYTAEVNRVNTSERDRLRVLTNVVASDIQGNLTLVDRSLEGVTQDFLAGPLDDRASRYLSLRLHALQAAIQGIGAFFVVDASGLVTAASDPAVLGWQLNARGYFKVAQSTPSPTTLYVSAPFRALTKDHDLVITVSRMIPGPHGEFAGLVVASLNQTFFSDAFTPTNYAPDVWGAVVHGDGVQLMNFPARKDIDGTNLDRPGSFFARHRQSGRLNSVLTGTVYTTGEDRLVVLQTIQPASLNMDKALVIALSRKLDVIAVPLHHQALVYALIYVVVALLCCGSLYWVQKRRAYATALAVDLERERETADERSRLNEALRTSEARFRTLIEDAPLAIAILRSGYFIYTNPRYRNLHGYLTEDDLTGLPWNAMISSESRIALCEQEQLVIGDSPVEQMFEAQGLGKGGRLVPVFKTTARVNLIDGPATLIFAQDISAQKLAESALLQARDAAEAANRSKADFLANMSHEIRSPLNAILGLAYLLEQAPLELDAHSMVRKIRTSGRMLLSVINDILDVSKIEAGHLGIEQTQFRLDDVMSNVANTMGIAVGDKNIQLIIQPLPIGISSVIGDSMRLEQVLSNLTNNAIKFTQQGHVELRVTVLSHVDNNIVLRFDIQDTGIGIAPELHSEMFSPFTQADSSTTRRFGGTGLGLTICRQLVGLMGGEIGLNSIQGQGSNFWFTLPLQLAVSTEFSSPDMAQIDALIADANEHTLQAVADIAHGMGWQVSAVRSGEAVLAQLLDKKYGKLPNVVVLEWKMPGMDGLATVRAIRASLAEDECPIVVMATAYSASTIASQPGAELVDAILNKPVTASTLYNATIEAQHRRAASVGVSPSLPQPIEQGLCGVRVLIVDDSEINRDVAQRILSEQGALVSLAVDGRAALGWLLAHPDEVDLVLMDVQMPVMDGIETTRQLRQLPQFDDLPIVALTAGAFKMQQDAARAAGMTHFISKPFDVPSTIALIQQIRRKQTNHVSDADGPADERQADRANPEPPSDFSVIDIPRGLKVWGDMSTYRNYLRRFADSYSGTVATINASLAANDRPAAAALAHKLAGVAGNFALPETHRLALEAERTLSSENNATFVLVSLSGALEQAIAAIERFVPAPTATHPARSPVPVVDTSAEARAELKVLLLDLLTALDGDNPGPTQAIFTKLSLCSSLPDLANIEEYVREFDFRSAETHVIKLAQDYDIILKE